MTHFAPTGWALIAALQPRKDPAMTLELQPGTYRQQFVRAHLPDGRIKDSDLITTSLDDPRSTAGKAFDASLKAAFGRWASPAGTRFEAMGRTVAVTATEWTPIRADEDAA